MHTILKFNEIVCRMIVIADSEASNYYANYTKKSWEDLGIKVNFFDAITPDKIQKSKTLNFSKYSTATKYATKNIKKVISETEKACWHSHYFLWEECYFSNEPILVLEHDSMLIHPENLWMEDSYGIIFFDAAAMGSYILTPKFAKKLIIKARTTKISTGPYGFIHEFGSSVVNIRHKKFKIASNQVMSKKYGNTINHYEGLIETDFVGHNFILID